ncbi:fucose mutarotase isoform X1 [Elephas maximus indicus]|uniref:fucose mutarotase isoform X1 n=1 Tax=Elephas maximus indicus TaxID=99487 RepID=UPI002116E4A9|nr:fucose mutarotase isoform X1 [Elephas maximus indicus]
MVVLKGVPPLLSRELLYALARMGPGDETILADANFRTSSLCQCGPTEICADGLGIPQLLEVVVKLLLLDSYMESPAAIMELVPSNRTRGLQIPLWRHYKYHLPQAGCTNSLEKFERFAFYERSKKAVAVVATRRVPWACPYFLEAPSCALTPLSPPMLSPGSELSHREQDLVGMVCVCGGGQAVFVSEPLSIG